jgi:hypothetical protein
VLRIPRYLTLGLLLGGALGAAATAIWMSTMGDPFDRATFRQQAWITRGLNVMASSPWAAKLFAALIAGAVAAAALFVAALVRPWRWPLAAAAVLGAGSIYPVWLAHDWAKTFEYPTYRDSSRYVEAAGQLATGITVYLALLAVTATAAALLQRRATA